jgi:3-oxoacyl-[acyl-carrier-protein] synthase-1
MKPVFVCGRGLASTLGLSLQESLKSLQAGSFTSQTITLPGTLGGQFPYFRIAYTQDDWNARAREIIQRVAAEAGVEHARSGALFIATSSFDIGAQEQITSEMDYNNFASKLATWLAWTGPVYLINTACTSSLNALLSAHALLQTGEVNDALVLGVELDNKLTLGGFAALQLLSPTGCKPFGAKRNGLVLGEAVSALRLSTHETSAWTMLGGANVIDGSQPTSASATAISQMYQRALDASGLSVDAIDLIKVQAAGSPGNDSIEAQGLLAAFPTLPALISLKALMGHTMGASGAAEIALLTACLDHDIWPEQAGGTDKSLGVNLASTRPDAVHHLMATILGFGGSHATVVLKHA